MTFRGYAATSASFRDAVLSTVMCSADGANANQCHHAPFTINVSLGSRPWQSLPSRELRIRSNANCPYRMRNVSHS